ncbi:tRNA (adenosine(37)-N6)-threonylcarbamoyltransferase complex dimerization subunit type 1 TsaB [Antrihabitans sp. YC2-6]|uniref:tRNA (adenosine(37)-N6)-threonylcarbamoyltransferase complex dimerization subunit type 1 TsaB n=1 Tax=Antrihabitans sp. YC2-6 TaxID=2799498 RepID=UPI0018F5BD3B|nr:tRNA (adenosine(37)-N6)-threonylcarbamoyltransferase complex dimerization subunit type 1 TsaB [Antrihabitans sp. YC2-6]MBJ8347438.1 tRNA (adenosine(37)-N6)-threonylcarbamoyltransferase complex dimerization subunit type 1 TsaB [Antrihabitans sp. YC2-6]
MLLLAVDTSTSAVTAGVVEFGGTEPASIRELARRLTVSSRAHAEVLTPQILECLAEAGYKPTDLDGVVVGTGPGPFTGLRVGMATAAAFGDALGIPVYGVCSLDAIAQAVATDRELLVVTDARRREVYWARYKAGRRVDGPAVCKPADLDVGSAQIIAGAAEHVDYFDLPVEPTESPSPVGLVGAAAAQLTAGATPDPLVPLYLRRPDAVAAAGRKK